MTQSGDRQMQALQYSAPRRMQMIRTPIPVPGRHEVLIRVAYSGICGSELSGFLGESSIRTPPLIFGHEISGHVHQAGAAVPPALAVGTAVAINPLTSCGSCRHCLIGQQQRCSDRRLLGATDPGGNAEYVAVPWHSAMPVAPEMDLAAAATVEPVAFALHAVQQASVSPSDVVIVIGAGTIGLLILQVLREFGVASRYVVEPNPDRLAVALQDGARALDPGRDPGEQLRDDGIDGADIAIDGVGLPSTRRQALTALRPGGRMLLVGLHSDATELPLNHVVRSELHLLGVFAYSPLHVRTALTWLAQGRVSIADHLVAAPLTDGQRWYERLVAGDPAVKVLLRPGAGS